MLINQPSNCLYNLYLAMNGPKLRNGRSNLLGGVKPTLLIFTIKNIHDITNNSTKLLYNISTRTIPRGAIFHVCPEAITYNINRRKKEKKTEEHEKAVLHARHQRFKLIRQ